MQIDNGAKQIIERLEKAGFSAWCVGGCVRDLIMGRVPNDWDIATAAKPEEVKMLFPKTVDTGIRHGTVTICLSVGHYEVTTYREEGPYLDSRHPSSVEFVKEISGDLSRRDFTVNAMAYHPVRGLLDLFGGKEDLKNRLIRCVGHPDRRFQEDALRMLRAVRFCATLGFQLTADTAAAILKHSAQISLVSAERVRDELDKLLLSERPDQGLMLMEENGLMRYILPEVHQCVGVEQNIKYHKYDVFGHTCVVTANVPAELSLRYAALLHDTGKPSCKTTDEDGVDHFKGHAAVSTRLAAEAAERLKMDHAIRDRILRLVKNHDREIVADKRAVKRAVLRVGEDIFLPLLDLKRGDCLGQNLAYTRERLPYYDTLEQLYYQIKTDEEAFSIRDLAINGNDLIENGLKGRAVGEMLRQMLDHVIDFPEENTKEALLTYFNAQKKTRR